MRYQPLKGMDLGTLSSARALARGPSRRRLTMCTICTKSYLVALRPRGRGLKPRPVAVPAAYGATVKSVPVDTQSDK